MKEEIDNIRCYIEGEIIKEPNAYIDRLQNTTTYLARTGVLLAEAKFILNNAIADIYKNEFELLKKLSPNQSKEYIKARTANEQYYVDLLDRLNASCVHQCENLRTLISYAKLEMQMM